MEMARHRAEDLFDALDTPKMIRQGKRFVGPCPVHGGDNPISFNFYPTGWAEKAFWSCYTRQCEDCFVGNLFGFVKGCLSHEKYGWVRKGDRVASTRDVVKFLCEFLDVKWDDLKPDMRLAKRQRLTSSIEILAGGQGEGSIRIYGRKKFRETVEIPAPYYMGRGYRPETLAQYDVGLCIDENNPLFGRVAIPIYDNEGRWVQGCIGRSPYEECPLCQQYHRPGDQCHDYSKVKTTPNFNDKNYLYNYWFAKEPILRTRRVLIVEGAADVWRLVEAGIHNCVAINGVELTERQQIILESCGATEIYCMTDMDEAGEGAHEIIKKKCGRFARTFRPRWEKFKDVGEMTVEQVRELDFIK